MWCSRVVEPIINWQSYGKIKKINLINLNEKYWCFQFLVLTAVITTYWVNLWDLLNNKSIERNQTFFWKLQPNESTHFQWNYYDTHYILMQSIFSETVFKFLVIKPNTAIIQKISNSKIAFINKIFYLRCQVEFFKNSLLLIVNTVQKQILTKDRFKSEWRWH